ncbi:MAG: cytochrome P450, partial [Candidatus Eremiobacterota bacterium]
SSMQAHGLAFLFGTENVFLGGGESWNVTRQAIAPYLSGQVIQTEDFFRKLESVAAPHLDALAARVRAGENELDILPVLQETTLDIAFQTLLGTSLTRAELGEVRRSFDTVMDWLRLETANPTPLSWSQMGACGLKDAYRHLSDLADRILSERRAQADPPDDLLAGLMRAVDGQGRPLTDERLRHEILTILLAGHETTATLMSWMLCLLSRDPESLAAVQADVDAQGGQRPTPEQLRGMSALQHTVLEVLRLHPPANFLAREAAEDTVLEGVECPMGTTLLVSLHQVHRSEDLWGVPVTGYPADEFHPERMKEARARSFPFGGGRRMCTGAALGRAEAALIPTLLLQRFELLPSQRELRMTSDFGVHPEQAWVVLREAPPAGSP